MITKIMIVLVVLVVGVLLFASTRPDNFSVVRSIHIKASQEQVFPYINNFGNWKLWSPWEKMDPDMKRSFSGPAEGVGTKYGWDGNNKVGQGAMEITESQAQKVIIKLDFMRPFEAHNTAEFNILPEADGVKVVWEMRGPSPFISKLMGIFMNMDEMIGKDFEAGLNNLKQQAETGGKQ